MENKISFTKMFWQNMWLNGVMINYLDTYILGEWNGEFWDNCKSVNLQTQTIIDDNITIKPIYTTAEDETKNVTGLEIIKKI